MKLHRIYGVWLRYMYLFKHSMDRQSDAFYWPTVDLVMWGLTSSYVGAHSTDKVSGVLVVISGLVLWVVLWRGQYEITVNILEDMWNKNLINMFAAPLKLTEWMASFISLGFVKAGVSLLYTALMAFVLYKVRIFARGFELIPFLLLLMMTGWWVGFFVGGLIVRYGGKVQNFAWSMVYLIAPFSAIYYPLSTLPHWAQSVAAFIPTSYIFEGARDLAINGRLDGYNLLMAFSLNLLYLAFSLWFFNQSFKKVLQRGLVKLY